MRLLLLAVFAILGYAGANCGCLKCSKHLTVVGEIPGAPGQQPIKVIARCDRGYPNVCDAFVPVQPIIQVPAPQPEPSVTVTGQQYPVKFKPFFKPCIAPGGCYIGSGAITGPLAAGNPCAAQGAGNVYTYSDYYGPIVPVKVQVPAQPEPEEKKYYTLKGLRTAVDRIIIPAPGISPTGESDFDRYVSGQLVAGAGCGGSCGAGCGGGCGSGFCHPIGCCSCHHRYDHSLKQGGFRDSLSPNHRSRCKRQLLQHGYKFIVNMLPPFIQEPIKDTVNKMAITHPDKKLRKVYNLPPPPLTLKEKIELKHKQNVAALKNKLFGKQAKPTKKSSCEENKKSKRYNLPNRYRIVVDESKIDEESSNFVDSLLKSEQKRKKTISKTRSNRHKNWLKETTSAEVLGQHFAKKRKPTGRMTRKEKAMFLAKLQKLNQDNKSTRPKRSIIIGSDELNLPLYQVKVKDSTEENEVDSYEDYDYEEDNESEERVGKGKFDASKEELIRRAIREELKKFRQIQSEEELEGDPISLLQNDKFASKFPLLRVLTFPMKLLKGAKNNEDLPIVGAVPRMIIGTKNYFKDFGKNLKKNFLHFTSDIIGDFDTDSKTNNFLANIVKANRLKRNLEEKQNFFSVSNAKVRKKRYILKMVDDDEIEELLRKKLGRILDEPQTRKPRRKSKLKPKMYTDNSEQNIKPKKRPKKYHDSSEIHNKRRKSEPILKKTRDNSMEELKKKVTIEPIKTKVIIDNNGLPFMEVNGYKRPLFMKHLKLNHKTSEESPDRYDSSEEVNLQKIHHVIDDAKHHEQVRSRHSEVPLETLKDKISQLLYDIDMLVHMDFDKYDDIYDDLIEVQSVKTSIVQSWKRIVMSKKINDYGAKIELLEKFEHLQRLKTETTEKIVAVMEEDCENSFALRKSIEALMALHKIQCIIDQVVTCFQEKFKTGTKFDMAKEIKFVDFLASLRFVRAKTRNDMIDSLKEERDEELQENIALLEKLKKLLDEDDETIEEEANTLWEMKHVQQMQINTIKETHDRLKEGLKIKKNMKILFDLSRRLKLLQEKEKQVCSGKSVETSSEERKEDEDKSDEEKVKMKKFKFDAEELKKKWKSKFHKKKEFIEEDFKKKLRKLKKLKEIFGSAEVESGDEDE